MTSSRKTMGLLVLSALAVLGVATRAVRAEDKMPADKSAPSKTAQAHPEPASDASEPVEANGELAKIEQDLAIVMDELVSARARAGVLSRSLFHTELKVDVIRRADAQNLRSVVLRLDGVTVHESDGSALSRSKTSLFSGYVTPGRHELAIELVEAGKDDPTYGYTRSERYRIEVKKDKKTRVELTLKDSSDMAEEAAEGDEGDYQIETSVRVRSEKAAD